MTLRRILLSLCLLAAFASFIGLGLWQLERRVWKLDLIARVDARLAATPTPAPGPADWPAISRENDEYRRVTVSGRFHHDQETAVQAVTELGGGYWILTPLQTPDFTVLINRGCRVAFKSGTRRVGQRLLPLNVTFRRQLVGVFPCFAVQSGQLLQEDGALFQTHEARQLLRTHRGQCLTLPP